MFSTTEAVVNSIMSQVNTMDQRAVRDESLMNFESYFHYLAALALLLLVIEFFMNEKRRIKEVKRKPAIAALLLLLPGFAFSQEDHELVKQGNEAYKRGDMKAAIQAYAKAAEMNAGNQAAIYNLAGALYKAREENKSLTAYDMAIKSAKKALDKSNAHYNKGVVLQNGKNPELCIEEYKNALRINPNDEDARHNLQLALRKQKEKQQQQDKSDKSKSDNSEQKPKPSRLSQRDAEQKLQALEQQERNLHDKLKKANSNATNQPEKDW
jgi:tetratricopeptide (TPR) repeat protein